MSEGFLLDRYDNDHDVCDWVEGQPEAGMWFNLKLRDRLRLPTQAFRCAGCGFVELYAKPFGY